MPRHQFLLLFFLIKKINTKLKTKIVLFSASKEYVKHFQVLQIPVGLLGMPVIYFPTERLFNCATLMRRHIAFAVIRNFSNLHLKN